MSHEPPIYDLMLLLSKSASDEDRAKVLADVQSAIDAGGGTVVRNDQWGTRPLTYRISHEAEAEYHLLQLTGPPTLLESLSHSLRIADSVLRFRMIKVRRGTPAPPSSPPPVVAPVAAPVAAAAAPVEG
jgi:small subunit ribosomal protein S6